MSDFFDIPDDVIKQAEAESQFKMVVPPTARDGKKSGKFWTEHGLIEVAFSQGDNPTIAGKECEVMHLEFHVRVDKEGTGLNGGFFPVRGKIRINRQAIGLSKDVTGPMKGQRTMTYMSLARLKGLMTLLGQEADENGNFSQAILAHYFPPLNSFTSGESPLVGMKIWMEVKQEEVARKDGQGKFTAIEINKIISIE